MRVSEFVCELCERVDRTTFVRRNIFMGVGLDGFEVEVAHGNILRNVIVSIVVGNFCCGKMAIYEQAWYMNGQIVFK